MQFVSSFSPGKGLFVSQGGWGEGKRKARVGGWKVKREEETGSHSFCLPIIHRALIIF